MCKQGVAASMPIVSTASAQERMYRRCIKSHDGWKARVSWRVWQQHDKWVARFDTETGARDSVSSECERHVAPR